MPNDSKYSINNVPNLALLTQTAPFIHRILP